MSDNQNTQRCGEPNCDNPVGASDAIICGLEGIYCSSRCQLNAEVIN